MGGRDLHFKGRDGQQEPSGRASCKTLMTRDYLSSKPGNRGAELAAGLAQVNVNTIAKALVNEGELSEAIEKLSLANPEKSRRLRIAEKIDKNADPLMVLLFPVGIALCFISPWIALGFLVVSTASLMVSSIWASLVKKREDPDGKEANEAKKKLAEVRMAKAEVCAKTGLSERMVETLQALPLDATQKHTVLKQAIFQDVPEDYVKRVAGILDGVAARGESLVEFAERKLEYVSRGISQAQELEAAGDKSASCGDNAQAYTFFVEAAKALEWVLDYAGAAEMYMKASGASPGNGAKAAELSAKSAECRAKAGNNPSAS